MGMPQGVVEAAAIAKMQADSTLQGLLGNPTPNPPGNVFDSGAVPTNWPFPYIVAGTITTQKGTLWVMGMDANDVYLQITGFTKYGGFSQARGIMARVHDLFDQQSLTLSGFSNPFTAFDNAIEHESGEEGVQQIDHRYKIMTQG